MEPAAMVQVDKAKGSVGGTVQEVNNKHWISEDSFLEKVVKTVLDSGAALRVDESIPVVEFKHPTELLERFDLGLTGAGCSDNSLLEACREVIRFSVRTAHPFFYNQLYGGVDEYGLAGAWLTESLNTNQYTFEVAPVFGLVEHAVLAHLRIFTGFSRGDGIFAPGGSISNMYGMVLARYRRYPDVKRTGVTGMKPLVAFTSEEGHYSILKGANWLGIGYDNVVKVPCNASGQMIPSELDRMIREVIEEGREPFFVNATAGTTVLGAFDPLEPLADICTEHGLWLHVDACWGGSALVSRNHRHLLRGIERVDSVAWNLHKMIGAPLQCSAFLIKEQGILHQCNSAAATYLFQQDKFYDVSYDTGDKSVQCGRKVDGFKLWLMWKARGDHGMETLVDNVFDCAGYITQQLRVRKGFRLVLPEFECTNVCFWYIPPRLCGQQEDEEWWKEVGKVAPKIKEQMVKAGRLMIGYQPLAHRNWPNFFRLVLTCQPPPTYSNMDAVLDQIDKFGCDL